MAEDVSTDREWHLDKRVPLAFIAALIFQTVSMLVGAAWYSAKVDARIAALEANDLRIVTERDIRRKVVDDKVDLLYRDRDRLVRVETQIEGIAKTLVRIETKLDRDPPRN